MAVGFVGRVLVSKLSLISSISLPPLLSRSFSASASLPLSRIAHSSALLRVRPLTALIELHRRPADIGIGLRCFSTRPTTSSLNDPSPNWSNRPPKETILLDGCDFEHWLVVMEPPEGNPSRDEIIDSYIKTLAQVLGGSEEEARMKIYSVSTRHYYAFGCLVSEELSYKLKPLPKVRWVLPDSYLDVKNKDYGGEPFIDGKAVPYDPKYHEEWVRNNARANERSRRNDRPRNFDRSRNFERRRENMQNRDFQGQSRDAPPMPNMNMQNATTMGGTPNRDVGAGGGYTNMPPSGGPPGGYPNMPPSGGPGVGYSNTPNSGEGYSNRQPSGGPSGGGYSNVPPTSGSASGYSSMPPSGHSGGYSNLPPSGGPTGVYSNVPPSGGPSGGFSNMPNMGRPIGGYSNMPNSSGPTGGYSNIPNNSEPTGGGYSSKPIREVGGMQNREYQNSYVPDREVGSMSSGTTYQGRDVPGRDY